MTGESRGRRRIIIADDDDDVRGLLEIAARKADLEIISSHAEGRTALESALATDPDLLLLDVMMPELTGLDVVRAVRAARSDGRPRVLLVSAGTDVGAPVTGAEAGADEYVLKPFTVRRIVERLRRWAEQT